MRARLTCPSSCAASSSAPNCAFKHRPLARSIIRPISEPISQASPRRVHSITRSYPRVRVPNDVDVDVDAEDGQVGERGILALIQRDDVLVERQRRALIGLV